MLIIFFKLKSELESSFNSKKNLYEIYSSNILNYPNQKFITDKSYETIGLVLENKKLFDEFNKTYKYKITKDLFYFKNEKEFKKYNDNKKNKRIKYLIELIQIKNDSFNFKLKTDDIYLNKLIADEESDLIISEEFINTVLDYWSFPVHNFLLNYFNKTNNKNFNVFSYPFSNLNTHELGFSSDFIIYFSPITISCVYSVIFLNISLRMIDEKEKKLDILLNRYGIKKYQYYFSWFIYYIILTIFINFCSIFTFSHLLFDKFFPFVILFFINHILFSIGIFSMAFFTQTIVSTLKTGQTLFRVLFFGIGVLGIPVIVFDTPKIIKIIFSLFPHVAQMENLQIIYLLKRFENKLNYRFYFSKYHKISFVESLFYLILDIIIYIVGGFLILSYKESGIDFISFILSPIYGKKREINEENNNNKQLFSFESYHEDINQKNKFLEEQNKMLNIKNITRRYNDLIAVNNFTSKLFENEIFCLLGHNGAGKSTLIKMISGIEDPDNGDIFLNNKSLITNKQYLYENIGLCSQDDIFFDYLTVEEHLKYMSEIKGNNFNIDEINDLLIKIDLISKKNSICKILSGGEKRKLCIALALIGNSKLILLDEPTSGMDVIAKKSLWQFLKGYKKDKIIILTTHSLDEAEYLGDRIGIMKEGHFICSGTSSYLKNKYPCGYNINLILDSKKFNKENKNTFLNEIKNIYSEYKIKISSKGLLSISYEIIDKRALEIFNYIDNVKNNIGIEDYTIATTSLEDVFLKLNISDKNINIDEVKLNEGLEIQNNPQNLNNESSSFFIQLYENVKRNLICLWRSKSNFIIELIASLTILILYILIFQFFILNDNSKYRDYTRLLSSNKIYTDKDTKEYLDKSFFVQHKKLKISYEIMDFKTKHKDNITKTLNSFFNEFSNKSILYNEKIAIFKYENTTNITFFLLYQHGNSYYRNLMNTLSSSAYFSSLGINTIIYDEYANFPKGNYLIDSNKETFTYNILLILIFTFISFSGFGLNKIVKEKETNIKYLLYLSGANMYSYWFGFFIVDIIKYFIIVIISFSIILPYNFDFFILLLPLCIFFSFPMCLFLYFFSFSIDKEEQSYKSYFTLLILLFLGLPFIFLFTFLFIFGKKIMEYYFHPLFISPLEITPITSLANAVFRITVCYDNPKFNYGKVSVKSLMIVHIIFFIIEFFIWGILLKLREDGYCIGINKRFLKCCCSNKSYEFSTGVPINDDKIIQPILNIEKINEGNYEKINNNNIIDFIDNRISEINNINNSEIIDLKSEINNNILNEPLLVDNDKVNDTNDILNNKFINEQIEKVNNNFQLTTKIKGLTKTFYFCCKKNLRVVNNLYIGLEQNEKFGLLGFNGSGKSTTFKCITNEIYYDSGEIHLFNYDTKLNFNKIRKIIGYCPQENPLFEYLTVRETLSYYKILKKSKESIERICNKFGIEKYIDKYCIELSGGNKRKLTFAIALMNYPKILLLDEPSTGVDPENRRIMWKNINELSLNGNEYNMILSTHSIEEAEILCDTVSWLKNGNFICVGNPEKLKLIYSTGYNLHIKFIDDKINENIKNGIFEHKNLCDLKIENGEFIMDLLSKNMNYNIDKNDNNEIFNLCFYVDELYNVLNLINDKCDKISLRRIGKDYSFELNILVKKDKQGILFNQILNIKTTNDLVSEVSINMESLENILTKL